MVTAPFFFHLRIRIYGVAIDLKIRWSKAPERGGNLSPVAYKLP